MINSIMEYPFFYLNVIFVPQDNKQTTVKKQNFSFVVSKESIECYNNKKLYASHLIPKGIKVLFLAKENANYSPSVINPETTDYKIRLALFKAGFIGPAHNMYHPKHKSIMGEVDLVNQIYDTKMCQGDSYILTYSKKATEDCWSPMGYHIKPKSDKLEIISVIKKIQAERLEAEPELEGEVKKFEPLKLFDITLAA